jgi:hypothetical protein
MKGTQYPNDLRLYISESSIPFVCDLNREWGDKTVGITVNKIIVIFNNAYLEDTNYEQGNTKRG